MDFEKIFVGGLNKLFEALIANAKSIATKNAWWNIGFKSTM